MTPRMRRIAIAVAGILVAVWLVLTLAGGALVARTLSRATGLVFRIGALDVSLAPPGLTARRVHVRATSRGPTAIVISRVTLVPWLRAIVRGEARLARVRLVNPSIRLRRDAIGELALIGGAPVATSPAAAVPESPVHAATALVLDRLDVRGGRLTVTDATLPRPRRTVVRLKTVRMRDLVMRDDGSAERADFVARLGLAGGAVGARGRYRNVGDTALLRVGTSARGIDLTAVAPYLPGPLVRSGKLTGRAVYARSGGAYTPLDRLAGDLSVTDLAVGAGEGGLRARLARLHLGEATIDLRARAVHVESVLASDADVTLPTASVEPTTEEAVRARRRWTVDVVSVALSKARIDPGQASGIPVAVVQSVHGRNLSSTRAGGTVVAAATLASGGRLRARGTVDPAGPTFNGTLAFDDVALTPLAASLATPIKVNDGRVSGRVTVGGPPLGIGRGTVTVTHFGAVAPREGGQDPVLALDRLDARVDYLRLVPPIEIGLRRLALSWPYLVVRRDEQGLYPLYLFATHDAAATQPGAMRVVAADATIGDGTVFFEDRVVTPTYLGSVSGIQSRWKTLAAPPFRVGDVTLKGRLNEIAPLTMRGRVDSSGVRLITDVERLPLVPLNVYLTPATGYVARSGGVNFSTDLTLKPGDVDAATRIALTSLDLGTEGDQDLIGSLVGVPFTLALALMKDYRGRINLDLPIRGNPTAPDFSSRGVILRAVRDAIVGAISTPLRLIGSVFMRDGAVESIQVDPLPFLAGRTEPTAHGSEQLDRLAVFLRQSPNLVVTLRGQSGEEDATALRDLELVGRFENGKPDATERAILAHLRGLLDPSGNPPPPLDDEQAKRLAALRAELVVPPDRLAALADARSAWVRARLIERYGVTATRLEIAPATTPGPAAVLVELPA
jgi:hypothetical protein